MAELLVTARDLDSGYKKGDVLVVKPNGWTWGKAEGLPSFWRITVNNLLVALVEPHVIPLWEPAVAGDPEFDEADEADRRILRHRRLTRVMWDEMPPPWLDELETSGRLSITKNQVGPFMRELRYNRGQGRVEKTNARVF